MKKTASAMFSIKSWDEKPYSEGKDLPKMTRASVDKTFTGDIDGEGHVEYVMMYPPAHGRLRRRPRRRNPTPWSPDASSRCSGNDPVSSQKSPVSQ
jgi:hypothetical protein